VSLQTAPWYAHTEPRDDQNNVNVWKYEWPTHAETKYVPGFK
jgi:hypothetical protein